MGSISAVLLPKMLKACFALRPRHPLLRRFTVQQQCGPGTGKTVAVAMSGGIDSAVAALLLQDQGYNCVGVFMKNWDPADECGSATCDISADVIDMKQVCKRLNIPSYEVNSSLFLFTNNIITHK